MTAERFLWGAALTAYCVEGRPHASDWWLWEQRPGRIAGGGSAAPGIRHAERYEADIALAAKLGLDALLVGLEWSRIEPEPGVFSAEAIEGYAARFQAIREAAIMPVCALQHAALPVWFARRGGWEQRDAPGMFAAYVRRVIERLGALCPIWIPLAEPMHAVTMGYGAGLWPPGKRNVWSGLRSIRNMARAHGAAYRAIHAAQPAARVGPSVRVRRYQPSDPYSAADLRVARREEHRTADVFLDAVMTGRWPRPLPSTDTADCADFAGVAYFGRERIRHHALRPLSLGAERVDDEGRRQERPSYAPDPEGFRLAVERVAARGLPVWVTGNGVATGDDAERERFLAAHVAQVDRLRAQGVDLRGYFHYALLDGFEWDLGWSARYGLIHADVATGARTPNPSAYLYRDIAARDGLPASAARRLGLELDADHRD